MVQTTWSLTLERPRTGSSRCAVEVNCFGGYSVEEVGECPATNTRKGSFPVPLQFASIKLEFLRTSLRSPHATVVRRKRKTKGGILLYGKSRTASIQGGCVRPHGHSLDLLPNSTCEYLQVGNKCCLEGVISPESINVACTAPRRALLSRHGY